MVWGVLSQEGPRGSCSVTLPVLKSLSPLLLVKAACPELGGVVLTAQVKERKSALGCTLLPTSAGTQPQPPSLQLSSATQVEKFSTLLAACCLQNKAWGRVP